MILRIFCFMLWFAAIAIAFAISRIDINDFIDKFIYVYFAFFLAGYFSILKNYNNDKKKSDILVVGWSLISGVLAFLFSLHEILLYPLSRFSDNVNEEETMLLHYLPVFSIPLSVFIFSLLVSTTFLISYFTRK